MMRGPLPQGAQTSAQGIASPFGNLSVSAFQGAIIALHWQHRRPPKNQADAESALLAEAAAQLRAYFAGKLGHFELPLAPAGSAFQQQVFRAMQAIDKGRTRTYGELAKDLNTSPQPIGQACGANPIPIIIPCHRVLGTGKTGGFSGRGGVETKIALLQHEGASPFLL